jgi:hypothetical protein
MLQDDSVLFNLKGELRVQIKACLKNNKKPSKPMIMAAQISHFVQETTKAAAGFDGTRNSVAD